MSEMKPNRCLYPNVCRSFGLNAPRSKRETHSELQSGPPSERILVSMILPSSRAASLATLGAYVLRSVPGSHISLLFFEEISSGLIPDAKMSVTTFV
jgi:hypothetical protein